MICNRVLSDVRVPIVTADFNHIVNWSSSKTRCFILILNLLLSALDIELYNVVFDSQEKEEKVSPE